MKTMRYLGIMLVACLALNACQEVEEAVNNTPAIVTDATEKYTGTYAYLSGQLTTTAESCYFLLSTSPELSDAQLIEAYTEDDGLHCYAEAGNLMPGTTYYYVLCATDGHSEVRGSVQSFTTSAYLEIESVQADGKRYEQDILGVYLTNANQTIVKSGGNMRALRNDTYGYDLPYNFMLTEPSYTVYAYSPYNEKSSAETLNRVPVNVYGENNVLYGSCKVTSQSPHANIEMKSALAKVYFSITTDSETPLTISYVSLRNSQAKEAIAIEGTLDLASGKITPAYYGGDGMVVKPKDASVQAGTYTTAEMMVIPTTFEDGDVEVYCFIDDEIIRTTIPGAIWEAGKSYEIPLTITRTNSSKAKVGDYYYSDGTWSTEYNANKECIGIVFALCDEAHGDINPSLEEAEHGRIVALRDLDDSAWGNANNVYEAFCFSNLYGDNADYGYLPVDGNSTYMGEYCNIPYNYTNWITLPENENYKRYALCDYKGADWTHYFGYGNTAGAVCYAYKAGNKQWFLPSVGEIARLAMAYGVKKVTHNKQSIFQNPTDGNYWTSCAVFTYNNSGYAWAYRFDNGQLLWENILADGHIRPIASF